MKRVFIVYGITDCPSCLRACADLMDEYPKEEYVFVSCDFSATHRENLKDFYSWYTFPIVTESTIEGEKLIGGHAELKVYLADVQPIDGKYPKPPIRDKD